jgi:sterol desaturase/sphingolipid hydroxylase (fatty acid hydroxylase superfamily)
MFETVPSAAAELLASCGNQIGGTFLAPGSTYSLAALLVSLLLFTSLAIPRGRSPRVALLRRALFPRRIWRSESGRTDIAYFVLGLLFAGAMIGWALFSAQQVRDWIRPLLGPSTPPLLPGWASAAIATPLLFLAYEFAYWLDHWLMHHVPLLWRFHKVHHQAESLSLLTNGRVHPVETIGFYNLVALTTGMTAALLDRLTGSADPWTIGGSNALIMIAAVTITHLQHSHLWVTFGPRWGRVLLGPAHHQIHHSADPAHFNRNLGSSLTLFDRLFGTFHMPADRREQLQFGVDDGETHPHGLRAALFEPFLGPVRPLWLRARRLRNQEAAVSHPVGDAFGPVA